MGSNFAAWAISISLGTGFFGFASGATAVTMGISSKTTVGSWSEPPEPCPRV
jgi:hypothetical protein